MIGTKIVLFLSAIGFTACVLGMSTYRHIPHAPHVSLVIGMLCLVLFVIGIYNLGRLMKEEKQFRESGKLAVEKLLKEVRAKK